MRCITCAILFSCSAVGVPKAQSSANAPRDEVDGARGGAADAPGPSKEQEVESTYQTPVATGRFVWIANPASGRVALVDAQTLETRTVLAGNAPTFVTALGAEDATAVINVGGNDATILRVAGADIHASNVPLAAGMNAWATAKSGKFAVAWTDVRRVQGAAPTQGFQDLTVVNLQTQKSTVLSVGYRPSAIAFNQSETFAYATNQDGITVIDLSGPAVSAHFPLTTDLDEALLVTDVSITPDGTHAVARIDDSADVLIVTLADGNVTRLTMPGVVTDLDLVPGGGALAMLRALEEVALIDTDTPGPPTILSLAGSGAGSVSLSADGAHGVAYTNASDVESVSVLGLTPLGARAVRVYASVLAAFPAPNGTSAVVLHNAARPAFSLVPMATALPAKIVDTGASPMLVAYTAAADRALVVQRDDARGSFGVSLCKLPSMEVDAIALGSPPIAAGIVEGARRGYIAQLHPQGRLTFVDLDSGDARTLTGFELGARVVAGGGQ